jgi:hypothetical protein
VDKLITKGPIEQCEIKDGLSAWIRSELIPENIRGRTINTRLGAAALFCGDALKESKKIFLILSTDQRELKPDQESELKELILQLSRSYTPYSGDDNKVIINQFREIISPLVERLYADFTKDTQWHLCYSLACYFSSALSAIANLTEEHMLSCEGFLQNAFGSIGEFIGFFIGAYAASGTTGDGQESRDQEVSGVGQQVNAMGCYLISGTHLRVR